MYGESDFTNIDVVFTLNTSGKTSSYSSGSKIFINPLSYSDFSIARAQTILDPNDIVRGYDDRFSRKSMDLGMIFNGINGLIIGMSNHINFSRDEFEGVIFLKGIVLFIGI
jgi:hypothetical protein